MSDVSSDDECPDLIPVPERPVASDEPAYKIPVTIITGFLGKIVHIFLLWKSTPKETCESFSMYYKGSDFVRL